MAVDRRDACGSKISIILPFRNAAATLQEAVSSCLSQTHEALELLLVDDASEDESLAIATRWEKRDPRVRVVALPEHRGVAAAFQAGLECGSGDWIARMDADDQNHPRRLEAQLALLQKDPTLDAVSCLVEIRKGIASGWALPDEGYRRFQDWLNELVSPEAIAAARFIDQPVVNPTMLVRRGALEQWQGYRSDLSWAEDYDLWLRLLESGGRIAKVPEILFTWADHPHRLTRNDDVYTQQAFIDCKVHYLGRLPQVKGRGVSLCGAGPIGKAVARGLQKEGVVVHQFFEVHPRRIGEIIHGTPVHGMETWGHQTPTGPVALGAVGQPGKRAHVEALARERGYQVGVDFFSVA